MCNLSSDILKLEAMVYSNALDEAQNLFHVLMRYFTDHGHQPITTLFNASNDTNIEALIERFCSISACLVCNQNTTLNLTSLDQLIYYQTVFSRLFLKTKHKNADYILDFLLQPNEQGVIAGCNKLKSYLFFTTETKYTALFEGFKSQDTSLYFTSCLMLIWAHSSTEQSGINREWAYRQIEGISHLTDLDYPMSVVHGYFMHSSYGFAKNKHLLKRIINESIALKLQLKYADSVIAENTQNLSMVNKKNMFIILENYHYQHSVYRVLGKSIAACRSQFNLIAIVMPSMVSDEVKKEFDSCITLSGTGEDCCIAELINLAKIYNPVVVYYPSIGMSPWTIHYSNFRLAPIQINSVGHAASSYAKEIDYFVIESDIAGDEQCYSEKLLRLPIGAMPFIEPRDITYVPKTKKNVVNKHTDSLISIACSLSTMKLNYTFLKCCADIANHYKDHKRKVRFTFFMGNSNNSLASVHFKEQITNAIPEATVYFQMSFNDYLAKLTDCDITLSPFPYGNMNGLIDSARLGIPGVCLRGDELHEAIDAGMWARMGAPASLCVDSIEAYINAVIKLVDDDRFRCEISQSLIKNHGWHKMFEDRSHLFVEQIVKLVENI